MRTENAPSLSWFIGFPLHQAGQPGDETRNIGDEEQDDQQRHQERQDRLVHLLDGDAGALRANEEACADGRRADDFVFRVPRNGCATNLTSCQLVIQQYKPFVKLSMIVYFFTGTLAGMSKNPYRLLYCSTIKNALSGRLPLFLCRFRAKTSLAFHGGGQYNFPKRKHMGGAYERAF